MTAKKTAKVTAAKKPRAMKPKKQTFIALVVDRSGSMEGIRKEAFESINLQIAEIKANAKKTGETFVSYIQFDTVIETVFDRVAAKDLKPITWEQFQPRGGTALNDALGKTIQQMRQDVTETADTAYLVVVVSDGEENASREYSVGMISALTKQMTETDRWTFTYMMANLSKQQQQQFKIAYNVPMQNFATFTANSSGAVTGSAMLRSAISTYSTSREAGLTSVNDFYATSGDTLVVDPNTLKNTP